jgi:chorismate mutase
MDEFLKRSGAPERPKTNSYAGVVELVVEEENKDSKSLFEASSEDQKLKELFGRTSTEIKDEKKENSLEEILKRYTEKKKQDADKDVRPALKDLKDTTPKNLEKELEDLFKKRGEKSFNVAKDEDVCRLCEIVNDRLEEMHEVKQKEPNGAFALNSALQTLVKYADILDDNTPQVVTETSLPPFWQELKTARELFDKFDDFYAQKQVESVLALREMNHEKEKLLKTSSEDYLTSLHHDIKKYLKAERELKVLKKVLKTAYQQFFDTETVQADLDYLKREMTYYTNAVGVSNLSADSLWPNKNEKNCIQEKSISPNSKIRRRY